MKRTILLVSVLLFGVLLTSVAGNQRRKTQGQTQPKVGQPKQGATEPTQQTSQPETRIFAGFSDPNPSMTADGRTLPAFADPSRRKFAPAPSSAQPTQLLATISSEGSQLQSMLALEKIAFTVQKPTFDGGQVQAMLLIVVFPAQSVEVKSPLHRTPFRFSPGTVKTLEQVIARFGAPNETERWSSDSTRQIGLDAVVQWWGSVGVAASSAGAITHVLVRDALLF